MEKRVIPVLLILLFFKLNTKLISEIKAQIIAPREAFVISMKNAEMITNQIKIDCIFLL